MKCSAFFTAAAFACACLLQVSSGEEQATVHLRVSNVEGSNNDICYKQCESGTYCPIGEKSCRKPDGNKCFNPATSYFIDKCDPGFECQNGKCASKDS